MEVVSKKFQKCKDTMYIPCTTWPNKEAGPQGHNDTPVSLVVLWLCAKESAGPPFEAMTPL